MDVKVLGRMATGGNLSKEDKDMLLGLHPMQIVPCFDQLPFMFYRVDYEYTTNHGNKKQGFKIFVFNSFNPEIDTHSALNTWVKQFNKDYPHRQLSNVKFLESKCLGYVTV